MSLNHVDRQILALLQQDASLSTAEIADKVGLSQSPCWRRIAKLEQDGYIKKKSHCLMKKSLALICWFTPMYVYQTMVKRI